jgi:hypothetical protein
MKDAVDEHLSTGILLKNGIWKSPNQCPMILLVNFRVEFGHTTNYLNTGIHTAKKIFSQARSTIFIPAICLIDVLLDFWCEY